MVVHDDPHSIPLIHLDRWAGSATVVAPEVYDLAGHQFLLHGFGDQVEFLRPASHSPRKLRNVWRFHGDDPTAAASGSLTHVPRFHARSVLLRGRKQARCGGQTGTQAKRVSKEITSVLHGSSSSRVEGPSVLERPRGH